MKKVVAGMDLHSNNVVIGVMDLDGKRVATGKVDCDLKAVVKFLAPYKSRLEQVAVESTYNWYWLVDGLQACQYPVVLANPAGMVQYDGIKHADDTNDAFFLAELLRLKILPTGHIYDAQLRPVRDLLRRRLTLVHHRTALMLSFKSLYTRTTGQEMALSRLKALKIKEAQDLYEHPANQVIAGLQIKHIEQLTESIEKIEKGVLASARELPYYAKLATLPGVGRILGMTITLEVGDIKRFAEPGHFASYCRTVAAQRFSTASRRARTIPAATRSVLGVRRGGQFCATLRRTVPPVVRPQGGQNEQGAGDQSAGVQAGQSGLASDGPGCGLRPQAGFWATGQSGSQSENQENETLNLERDRQPGSGVGLEPFGLIGGGRVPLI
jgi:transposase